MESFKWDTVQYRDDGKVLLLFRHERVFQEGLIKPGMKVLDVGGWGHFTERVVQESCQCIVLDNFSPDQYFPDRVKLNEHIVANIDGEFSSIGLEESSFDLIHCGETLEHVLDQEKAVANISRLLKLGGVFVGTVPIPGYCHFIGEPGIKFLDEDQLRKLLEANGFHNVFIESTPSIVEDEVHSSLYFRGVRNV